MALVLLSLLWAFESSTKCSKYRSILSSIAKRALMNDKDTGEIL